MIATKLRSVGEKADAALVVLHPDDEADLERALDEADDDLEHGRHVPREAVFPRSAG